MTEERYDLVPYGDDPEEALGRVLDTFSKSGVSLAECLDTDSAALSASDLRYFDSKYFGKVPSYSVFMRFLNKQPLEVRDNFLSVVAETESARYAKTMDSIAKKTDGSLMDTRRFNMMKDLNKMAERRIDRMDKRIQSRAAKNEGIEQGVDMAARLITALSNADLLKIKQRVDTIDAEYQAMEVAESEPVLPPAESDTGGAK